MNTINRRKLLASAAVGGFSAAVMPNLFGGTAAAYQLESCSANHVQLSRNLSVLLDDASTSEAEKNFARKTCACIHCGVSIAPSI